MEKSVTPVLAAALAMFLLLFLEHFKVVVEPGVARVPESLELAGPLRNVANWGCIECAGAPLGLAAPLDESGTLEDTQVFGDRGAAHLERRRDLLHRGCAAGEPEQDRPPGGIGEGEEGGAEGVGGGFHDSL